MVSHDLRELSQQVPCWTWHSVVGHCCFCCWTGLHLQSAESPCSSLHCLWLHRWTLPGRCYRVAGCSTDRIGGMHCEVPSDARCETTSEMMRVMSAAYTGLC